MLDTDQLRSFLAIVDTGSFTRAADRVHKTQSAVSMHIRRLEERLGRNLFVKSGRGAKLTSDGERLIGYARQILRLEADALSAVGENGLVGRVRFGIPDDYAEPFLPAILTRFTQHHPLVEVTVLCERSTDLVERIDAHELDVAIVTECQATPQIEVIREEPLVWIAGRRFRHTPGKPLPLALGSATCGWRQTAEAVLTGAGLDYKLNIISNNFSAISPMVGAGMAITLLPRGVVRPDLVVLGAEFGLPPLPNSRLGILRPANVPLAPDVAAMCEAIRHSAGLTRADVIKRSAAA